MHSFEMTLFVPENRKPNWFANKLHSGLFLYSPQTAIALMRQRGQAKQAMIRKLAVATGKQIVIEEMHLGIPNGNATYTHFAYKASQYSVQTIIRSVIVQ